MSAPAHINRQHPPAEGRWRRATVVVLFMCLAILQGLAPLLHVHLDVAESDNAPRDGQRGVHLPVGLAHAGHAIPAMQSACAGMDDSAVITSPSELKRDELLALGTPVALAAAAVIAAVAIERSGPALSPQPPATSPPRLRPPAHAPPRIA